MGMGSGPSSLPAEELPGTRVTVSVIPDRPSQLSAVRYLGSDFARGMPGPRVEAVDLDDSAVGTGQEPGRSSGPWLPQAASRDTECLRSWSRCRVARRTGGRIVVCRIFSLSGYGVSPESHRPTESACNFGVRGARLVHRGSGNAGAATSGYVARRWPYRHGNHRLRAQSCLRHRSWQCRFRSAHSVRLCSRGFSPRKERRGRRTCPWPIIFPLCSPG